MILGFNWDNILNNESFVIGSCNRYAYVWVQNPNKWPKNQTIIYGPSKSGKTHLAKIWAEKHNATILTSYDLASYDSTKMITGPCVVDSIESIDNEEYLMNIFYQTLNIPVLWITAHAQSYLQFELNDLKTRFRSVVAVGIEEPDEDVFRGIIRKKCKDYGLTITNECLEYVTRRIEITYDSIHNFILKLHEQCLIQQRSPSTALMHDILKQD